MPVYLCPHCNKPGLSFLRRAFLGPAIPATCTACGQKIGVPYGKTLLACAPIILTPLLALLPVSPALIGPALAFATVLALWAFFRFVPLIKK